MTDTDRLLAVVRQFPGMQASAAFHRAGLRLSNNYRCTLVFNARRAGRLAPSERGERWGRLYPVEPAVDDAVVLAYKGPTRTKRIRPPISGLAVSVSTPMVNRLGVSSLIRIIDIRRDQSCSWVLAAKLAGSLLPSLDAQRAKLFAKKRAL
jgi:hypothetical protein